MNCWHSLTNDGLKARGIMPFFMMFAQRLTQRVATAWNAWSIAFKLWERDADEVRLASSSHLGLVGCGWPYALQH
jgi:predicted component of type VI protein secretion system